MIRHMTAIDPNAKIFYVINKYLCLRMKIKLNIVINIVKSNKVKFA